MVAASMHRLGPRISEAVARVSEAFAPVVIGTGKLIGWARKRAGFVPGLSGAALVAWGAAQVYTPAGWILGGLFLLAADRQIRLRPPLS